MGPAAIHVTLEAVQPGLSTSNSECVNKLQEEAGQVRMSSTTVFVPALLPHLLFNMYEPLGDPLRPTNR